MDLIKLSKKELLSKCEELGMTKCKSKNKGELIEFINLGWVKSIWKNYLINQLKDKI